MSAESVAAAEAAYEAQITEVVRLRVEGASEVEQAAARAKGRELAAVVNVEREKPYVGQPATINLWSDTSAAVVVKVNPKSIVVRRVAVGEAVQDMSRDGAGVGPAVMVAQGLLDQPIGEPERYSLVGNRYRNGSISISLGRSVQIRDYRY